jgi:hypothetical protein
MTRRSISILLAACAVLGVGCGSTSSQSVEGPATSVTITENFGTTVLLKKSDVPATSGLTALRQLETGDDVTTAYGGRYVKSIAGIAEDSDRSWLFYVDGVESKVGATAARLKPGQTVQWDIHAWQTVQGGGAIVGAYPLPLKTQGVRLVCAERHSVPCRITRRQLTKSGIVVNPHAPARIVVGPWNDIQGFDGVPDLTKPGDTNGAFAEFSKNGEKLTPYFADGTGDQAITRGAGLLAAFSIGPDVVWVVTGTDQLGAEKAASLLNNEAGQLTNKFAFAVGDDAEQIALPEGAGR